MQTAVPLPAMSAADLLLGVTLLAPVLVVIVTGIVVLLIDMVIPDWWSRRPMMWVASLGLVFALAVCGWLWSGGYLGRSAFGGFLVLDGFALFFQALFLLSALLVILSATTFADRQQLI
jgi:NADH:ubiquinone oxidoreductase subunit 2 (subunit N)